MGLLELTVEKVPFSRSKKCKKGFLGGPLSTNCNYDSPKIIHHSRTCLPSLYGMFAWMAEHSRSNLKLMTSRWLQDWEGIGVQP